MAGPKNGWARLAKSLKAAIDEDLIEAYRGTVSLPFEPDRRFWPLLEPQLQCVLLNAVHKTT